MSLGIHWGLGIGGRTAQGHTGMGGGRCHVHRPHLARTRSGTYLAPPPPKAPTYTAESLCPVVAFPGLSENRGIHNSRGKSHSRAGFSNIRRATWWMGDDNSFFIGDGTMKIIIISSVQSDINEEKDLRKQRHFHPNHATTRPFASGYVLHRNRSYQVTTSR